MRRRQFITLLGGTAAWPLGARAEPERMRRIGVLLSQAEGTTEHQGLLILREGLRKLGWEEGRNIRIDHRSVSDTTRIRQFAEQLVALQPDLIVTQNTATTASVLQQTRTIPIVFVVVTDPIGSGFIESLPRPGGNVTGFIDLEGSLGAKWLQLLKEAAPRVSRAAFLFNPTAAPYAEYYLGPFRAAGAALAVDATAAPVHDASELESTIAVQTSAPHAGLVVMPDAFTNVHRTQIISLALNYRVPAVYPYRVGVQLGALLSYGSDTLDNYLRAATYVDKILRGAKPSDLPVQTPIKFQLVVNLNTAKALGLEVPATLLARADEVIE